MSVIKSTSIILLAIVGWSVAIQTDHDLISEDPNNAMWEPLGETSQKNESFKLFPKRKKKQKKSSKMKRHNKSMGKMFKRKNGDSLRR